MHMSIRSNLSRELGIRRLSISEASRLSGVSYATLFKLYHDRSTRVDYETLDGLCRALGCQVSDILEYVPDEARK
jgi:putative transcriptional regulator